MAGPLILRLSNWFASAALALSAGAGLYVSGKFGETPEQPKDNTELSAAPGGLSDQHARVSKPAPVAPGTALSSRGQNYAVPTSYHAAIKQVTKHTPAMYDVMVQLLGSEGGFKSDAVSPTGAFSAAQFVGPVYFETLYKNAHALGTKTAKLVMGNVEKYDTVDRTNPANKEIKPNYQYRIIPEVRNKKGKVTRKGGDEKAILALAKDPVIISKLAFDHASDTLESGMMRYRRNLGSEIQRLKDKGADKDRIAIMEEAIERPMTSADLKTMYVGGARGGTGLLVAHADPQNRDKPAADFTDSKVVKANPNVFYHNDKRPKTLDEYKAYIVDRVGDIVIPPMESRMTPEQIKANQKLSEAQRAGPARNL